MDVQTVGDQAANGPRVGEGGPRQPRLAVVHRAHRVEQVRDAGDLPVQGAVGRLEGDVGVACRDHHTAVRGKGHELLCAFQLRGQRDHTHRTEVEEAGEQLRFRPCNIGRGVRTPLLQAYKGPFEVYAEHL